MKSSESSKRLLDFVEKSYKDYLKKENKAEELFQQGDMQALDMMVEKGDWMSAIEAAK